MFVTIIDGPAKHLGRIRMPLRAKEAGTMYRNGVTIAGVRYVRVRGTLGDQTLSCAPIDRRY